MNRARVAALLHELAEAILEDDAVPEDKPSRPRAKKTERRPRALTRPDGEVTPMTSALADRLLREKGFR